MISLTTQIPVLPTGTTLSPYYTLTLGIDVVVLGAVAYLVNAKFCMPGSTQVRSKIGDQKRIVLSQ